MDALIKDVIEHLKKTVGFLEKLKLDKKQKAERDTILNNLNQAIQKCEANIPRDSADDETYNDVGIEIGGKNTSDDVYNDVQGGTYDDVGDRSQTDGANAIYDDTEPSYDDLPEQPGTRNQAEIPLVECEKLTKPSFADFMEIKKDAGLKNFLKSPWQKRWCVLHGGILYLYENAKDKRQKEALRVNGYTFKNRDDISKEAKRKDRCFELRGEKTYEFCASDKESLNKWQAVLGGMKKSPSVSNSLSGSMEDTYDDVAADADSAKKKKGLFPDWGKKRPKSPSKPVEEENTYDDNQTADDIYEETADGNYDEANTRSSPPIQPEPDDVYEDTAPPPTPKGQLPLPPPTSNMPVRRASAKDELPPVPSSNKPAGFPFPPALPQREEIGSASGTSNRNRPPMPLPGESPYSKRGLPEVPPRTPSPGLPPPPADMIDDELPDGEDSLEGFGENKEDYENMYQGMWDCSPNEDNELMFKRGEIIHIISKEYDNYGWWIAESREEEVGLVPVSYLMRAYDI